MPVIPNFSGFAATPDLAGAYLHGVKLSQDNANEQQRLGLQQQHIAQQASSDAARIAQAAASEAQQATLARERIAASQVENQMRLEARQKIVDQQALQKAHEASIDAAYKNTQLGLADRRLQNQQQVTQMRLEQAQKQVAQHLAYERRYRELAPTMGEVEAQKQSMRETGFGSPGFYKSFEGDNKPPPVDAATKAQAALLEDQVKKYRTAALSDPRHADDLNMEAQAAQWKLQALLKPFSQPRQLSVPPTMTGNSPAPVSPQQQQGFPIPAGLGGTNAPTQYKKVGRFKILTP